MCDEPSPRYNHILVSIDQNSFLWGGQTKDFDSEEERKKLGSVVNVFDHKTRRWYQKGVDKSVADDNSPPGLRSGGFVAWGSDIFSFGGRDSVGGQRFNSLHQLDTTTLRWRRLPCFSEKCDMPMPKAGCEGVVMDDKLCLFGGYGTPADPPGTLQPKSKFDREEGLYRKGHTNEFHFYSLPRVAAPVWNSPEVSGDRPPPLSYYTMTLVDSKRSVLFGGNSITGRKNDVYVITINGNKVNFRELEKFGSWPEKRSSHAACVLNYGQKYPQLLVVGGLDEDTQTKGDMWLMSVDHGVWTKIQIQDNEPLLCRWRPCLSCISLGERKSSVLMFGGVNQEGIKQALTTILEFECVENSGGAQEWMLKKISNLGSPTVDNGLDGSSKMAVMLPRNSPVSIHIIAVLLDPSSTNSNGYTLPIEEEGG